MPRRPLEEGKNCIKKMFTLTSRQADWLESEVPKREPPVSGAKLMRKALNFLMNHEDVIDMYDFWEEHYVKTWEANLARGSRKREER